MIRRSSLIASYSTNKGLWEINGMDDPGARHSLIIGCARPIDSAQRDMQNGVEAFVW